MKNETYCGYFGLREKPFSLAADPRYLYMSAQHWEAMAHLMYGVEDDWGFVLVTGVIGAGKTTLCRLLLDRMPPEVEVAFIINPKVDARELLVSICDEFRIDRAAGGQSVKELFDLIGAHLIRVHAAARKALLIIDEAQYLSTEVLDLLRLLTNLETEDCKLLRIILIGQPQLGEKLASPELEQMSQRITARYHLGPLPKKEVSAYVSHRLEVAGAREALFSKSAISALYRVTGGLPRLINVIADRALLGACLRQERVVSRSTLNKSSREVLRGTKFRRNRLAWLRWAGAGALVGALGTALALFLSASPTGVSLPHPAAGGSPAVAAGTAGDLRKAGSTWLPPGVSPVESREDAYNAILAKRGVSYYSSDSSSSDSTFCANMEILDLRCLERKDPGRRIESLPVPSVVTLTDGPENVFYAAVLSLKGDRARVSIGEKEKEVSLAELQRLWSGEYMTLEKSARAAKKKTPAGQKKKSGRGKGR